MERLSEYYTMTDMTIIYLYSNNNIGAYIVEQRYTVISIGGVYAGGVEPFFALKVSLNDFNNLLMR